MSTWAIAGISLMAVFLYKAFLSKPKKSADNKSTVENFSSSENSDGSGFD